MRNTTYPVGEPTPITIRSRPFQTLPTRSQNPMALLNIPIAWRLTLGFLLAALIATLVASFIGLQHAQAIGQQAKFYQNLLQIDVDLTSGDRFLQLMDTKVHQALTDAATPTTAPPTLVADRNAVTVLATQYDSTVSTYLKINMLSQHLDQVALLAASGHTGQTERQLTLAQGTLRTWQLYQSVQQQVLRDLATGQIADAQLLERSQGEVTNSDALSALRALIQFNSSLASDVSSAADAEQQSQLMTAVLAGLIAFLSIGIIGWLISTTLVMRLYHLRNVTQEVRKGQLSTRVTVTGRDEIAEVATSVNIMLDAIVELLEETRRQRDALTNAAKHLFSDMRLASNGELQVDSAIDHDPIGMLANAFNFTIGRLRRFVLRTQTSIEQLEVISQREVGQAKAFLALVRKQPGNTPDQFSPSPESQMSSQAQNPSLSNQVGGYTRRHAQQLTQTVVNQSLQDLLRAIGQAHAEVMKLVQSNQLIMTTANLPAGHAIGNLLQMQARQARSVERQFGQLSTNVQMLQTTMMNELSDLNASLDQLSSAIQPGEASSGQSFSTARAAVERDFMRQAEGFAQEMGALGYKLVGITKEMQASVTPYQLDVMKRVSPLSLSSSELSNNQPSP